MLKGSSGDGGSLDVPRASHAQRSEIQPGEISAVQRHRRRFATSRLRDVRRGEFTTQEPETWGEGFAAGEREPPDCARVGGDRDGEDERLPPREGSTHPALMTFSGGPTYPSADLSGRRRSDAGSRSDRRASAARDEPVPEWPSRSAASGTRPSTPGTSSPPPPP